MSFFKRLLKVAKVVAPIALGFTPLGPLASAAVGAGLGATGGGGLKGALMGGAGGYIGAGGLTSTAAGGLGNTFIGQGVNALKSGASSLLGTAASSPLSGIGPINPGSGFLGSLGGVGTALSSGGSYLKDLLSGGGQAASQGSSQGMTSGFGGIGNAASNIYSAINTSNTAKKMANAQQAANQQALSAVSPFMQSGQAANTRLQTLLGTNGANSEEELATLRNSPGYQFRLQQGQEAQDRMASARGGLFSGRALQESQQLGQGLADQTYQDYVRNLTQQSSQGLQAAGGVANLYSTGGDIQANRFGTSSNARNKAMAGILEPQQRIDPRLQDLLRGYA